MAAANSQIQMSLYDSQGGYGGADQTQYGENREEENKF
jgi:hypothetical protein